MSSRATQQAGGNYRVVARARIFSIAILALTVLGCDDANCGRLPTVCTDLSSTAAADVGHTYRLTLERAPSGIGGLIITFDGVIESFATATIDTSRIFVSIDTLESTTRMMLLLGDRPTHDLGVLQFSSVRLGNPAIHVEDAAQGSGGNFEGIKKGAVELRAVPATRRDILRHARFVRDER